MVSCQDCSDGKEAGGGEGNGGASGDCESLALEGGFNNDSIGTKIYVMVRDNLDEGLA